MTDSTHTYELQALTDIWTGTAHVEQQFVRRSNRQELVDVISADRLIPTGLLGSIRWWFEVLVRGLGGAPCDPSSNQKACLNEQHCVVCELFGCTGWARKFRFDVRDAQGTIIRSKLSKNSKFGLRFTPLRAVKREEWALLELTLRLISDFGALGGKTVLKPSRQNNKAQHADFGLVKLMSAPMATHTQQQLASYVSTWAKKPTVNGAAWASCSHMWFVDGKHLTRTSDSASSFNKVLGRPEAKSSSSGGDSWRAGSRGVSKKVFSFKSPARTFGFVQQTNEFDGLRDELRPLWNQPATNEWFVTGDALVGRLFPPGATP